MSKWAKFSATSRESLEERFTLYPNPNRTPYELIDSDDYQSGTTNEIQLRNICTSENSVWTPTISVTTESFDKRAIDDEEIISGSQIPALHIHPNPVSHQLSLEVTGIAWDKDEKADLSVFNINGKLMPQKDIIPLNDRLDVLNLPAGTYLLQLRTGDSTTTQQFVKN